MGSKEGRADLTSPQIEGVVAGLASDNTPYVFCKSVITGELKRDYTFHAKAVYNAAIMPTNNSEPKPRLQVLLNSVWRQADHLVRWRFAQIGIAILPLTIGGIMLGIGALRPAEYCFIFAALWGILVIIREKFPHESRTDRRIAKTGSIIGICLVLWWVLTVIEDKRTEVAIHSTEGVWLVPAHKASPYSSCPVMPRALTIFWGDSVSSVERSFPHMIMRVKGEPKIVLEKNEEGQIAITMNIFDEQENIVAEIEHNHFTLNPNNYFKLNYSKDLSRLSVQIAHQNEKVLDLEYLNPSAVRILGVFRYRHAPPIVSTKSALFIGGTQFSGGSCFGYSGDVEFNFD